MRKRSIINQELPLKMVGGSNFGRYQKISAERTFNFIISDDWMVPNAGYKRVVNILDNAQGRGIYGSSRFNHLIAVIDNGVYIINSSLQATRIATINTSTGDVFLAENEKKEIAICDKKDIWIYNYGSSTFEKSALDFLPGFVSYQNGRFVSCAIETSAESPQWRLSSISNSTVWTGPGTYAQTFNKGDIVVAPVPFRGRENLIIIFGRVSSQFWSAGPYQLFPYQLNNNFNVNYGLLSTATIDSNDSILVWLGVNDKSGPAIMYTNGSGVQTLSTDGINFKLASMNHLSSSYGFLFKQDGHLIYQLTSPGDNYSVQYDFTTQKFFDVTDEKQDFHIAKLVAYFNNSYYFVSFIDGHLYELNSKYSTYDGAIVPRIRIPPNIRLPNTRPFVVNNMTFPIEQGESANIQIVDVAISKDGGVGYGSFVRHELNPKGKRKNMFNTWSMGRANDLTPQFRFYGDSRFVFGDGIVSLYQ